MVPVSDTSREVKPVIWQEREGYEFTAVNRHDDAQVFTTDKYLYGVRARVNAGFGLWQLAFGSKATLNATNYAAARAAMMGFQSDGGRLEGHRAFCLGRSPDTGRRRAPLAEFRVRRGGRIEPLEGHG